MIKSEFKGNPLTRHLFGDEYAKNISMRTFDGQSWYMALDICGLLGITNHSQVVRYHLTPDEYRLETIFTGRRNRRVLMINNSGMMKLIVRTRTERAEQFKAVATRTPAYLRITPWPEELNAPAAD